MPRVHRTKDSTSFFVSLAIVPFLLSCLIAGLGICSGVRSRNRQRCVEGLLQVPGRMGLPGETCQTAGKGNHGRANKYTAANNRRDRRTASIIVTSVMSAHSGPGSVPA